MIAQSILSRERDLGGFSVRRLLPHGQRRAVGPFVFFDHMGPADFPPGKGIDVRPHPHIHLATVTYLFEGAIRHRDSLGFDQLIEPGAINWMTAGHGIVHSERAPPSFLERGGRLHGIQLWVALPREHEDAPPAFSHHPQSSLPAFAADGARMRLLLGRALGRQSPVPVHSDLFYVDVELPRGETLRFPLEGREAALYLVSGRLSGAAGELVEPFTLAVASGDLALRAETDSRFVLLGGAPLGTRHLDWNFVSSRKEEILAARDEWKKGPGTARFPKIPGDAADFIPYPGPAPL